MIPAISHDWSEETFGAKGAGPDRSRRRIGRDFPIYWSELVIFAAASSWLLAAPGFKIRGFFGSMVGLAFGPMLEHVFETTSTLRWIFDSTASMALLVMILLRFRRNSKPFVILSHVGVTLWLSSAFFTLLNHGE